MLADQASSHHGATFVGPYASSLSHDACQTPEVNGWRAPPRPAYLMHSNALGTQAVTAFALDTLRDLAASQSNDHC